MIQKLTPLFTCLFFVSAAFASDTKPANTTPATPKVSAVKNPKTPAKNETTAKGVAIAEKGLQEFAVDGVKVKTIVPEGWTSIKGYMNTPLALVSKLGVQDTRTVIQIVPFNRKDTNDALGKMEKDPDNYYMQKEEMIDDFDGHSISYVPYEEQKKDGATIRSIGIRYHLPLGEFLDKSYYLTTKSNEVYYIKALIPTDLENDHNQLVSQIIETISTKN